jgi:hypothetical protein
MDHKYLFIGGLHRSGTWLHVRSLQGHPEISVLGETPDIISSGREPELEGQFLQSVYPNDRYYGGVGQLGFHPEAHLTEHSMLVTEENRRKLLKEWEPYWDTDKQYLLEKTPANLIRSRFLQAMFPNTRFIFIMRHPVAVALAQQKWTGLSVNTLLDNWLACYKTLSEDIQYLEYCLWLRYEDFVREPDAYLEKLYSFLEIRGIPRTQSVRSDGNERYFSIWEEALSREDTVYNLNLGRRLRNRIMPLLIRKGHPLTILANESKAAVSRFESGVNRFGYSLEELRKHGEFAGFYSA